MYSSDRRGTAASAIGKSRRSACIIAAGVLASAVLAAGAVILLSAILKGGAPGVPDVIGLGFAAAKARVESAKLEIEINPLQDPSGVEDVSRRRVVGQEPGAGEPAEAGTLVTVTLKGVPDRSAAQETDEAPPPPPAEDIQSAEAAPPASPAPPALLPPLEGALLYPFTRDASVACGQWEPNSQDYPYFGAPRSGGRRSHAGIDLYPQAGVGAPVRAMKDGTVMKVAPFYTRYTGEVTYGVLIDHGDFVANYAELKPPAVGVGTAVGQGQLIGALSGTRQLHFEKYAAGTRDWTGGWYGAQPPNLLDPTQMMLELGL